MTTKVKHTSHSEQDKYLELHTWYHYENSERCNPAEGTVPVQVFTVRNVSDIRRSDIRKRHFDKYLKGCPVSFYFDINYPFVNPPKRIWYNDRSYQDVYEDGWDIELLKIMLMVLNMTFDMKFNKEK